MHGFRPRPSYHFPFFPSVCFPLGHILLLNLGLVGIMSFACHTLASGCRPCNYCCNTFPLRSLYLLSLVIVFAFPECSACVLSRFCMCTALTRLCLVLHSRTPTRTTIYTLHRLSID
ncbi:hypothetical protein EXIGLDRAFT_514407 [Exidia glandulosa HHB12029]|uniref:Uncharacterized protein n=1 Tax=Exidia glandulosa HHB12029 TaxID=1314781 RepID=A0A166BL67_EXIGL|nr:hypothetical protein EXIGLDRAFT_514407 [Exidia glandulosa HHB12029]